MQPAGGDTNLRTKSEAEPVGEPVAGVVKDAGRVGAVQESGGGVLVVSDDYISVRGAVPAEEERRSYVSAR